jgi:hypothetical protein
VLAPNASQPYLGNLSFQQNRTTFAIAVVVLKARTNRLDDLRPLVPRLLETAAGAARGIATLVEAG